MKKHWQEQFTKLWGKYYTFSYFHVHHFNMWSCITITILELYQKSVKTNSHHSMATLNSSLHCFQWPCTTEGRKYSIQHNYEYYCEDYKLYRITINLMLLYIPFNDFLQCRDFNTFLLSTIYSVNHYSLKKFLKCFKSHERELPLREATVYDCC